MTRIECITQDPAERALADAGYLAACTGSADLMALSRNCVGTGCGGHPICRPCFEVGKSLGWVLREDAHD